MSTLVVDELYPGIVFTQTIYISKNVEVKHIRPWLYTHGTLVDGDLVCRIKDSSDDLKATSTITHTDINAAHSNDYSHGFIRFDFDPITLQLYKGTEPSAETTEFRIEFEMTNHTLDTNNFVGLCRSWDRETYPSDPPPPNAIVSPVGLEIYTYKEKI